MPAQQNFEALARQQHKMGNRRVDSEMCHVYPHLSVSPINLSALILNRLWHSRYPGSVQSQCSATSLRTSSSGMPCWRCASA